MLDRTTSFFSSKIIYVFMLGGIIGYTLLSYVLLFRDKRAIAAIGYFYPSVKDFLNETRATLLAHNLNTIPTGVFALIVLVLFTSYFISLKKNISLSKTILMAILFQIVILFSYPIIETDIFAYIFSDRVSTVYHQNVWEVAPIQFNADPFFKLADWTELTKIYGGVNQFFYNFASYLGGDSLIGNIATYKLLTLIFTLGSMFLVYKISTKYFKGNESLALRLIFWNPLFILEITGAGHNDILMFFFMLASYYFFLGKNWILAGTAIALAVQVKFISIVLLPFLGLELLIKRGFKEAVIFGASFTAVVSVIFLYMDTNVVEYVQRIFFNAGVYWQGLPSLIYKLFPHKTPIFLAGFILVNAGLYIYQLRKKVEPLTLYALSIFSYLVFFASAYWNWYALWGFMFVPFIKDEALKKAFLLFTFTSTFAYVLYWGSLRFLHGHIFWEFIFYGFILLFPFLAFVFWKAKELKLLPSKK